MKQKIQNTGDLREFLAMMLLGIKNGDIEPDQASRITKMAAQINESFYSEIKIARVMQELGETTSPLGELPIGHKEAK